MSIWWRGLTYWVPLLITVTVGAWAGPHLALNPGGMMGVAYAVGWLAREWREEKGEGG